MAYASHKSIFTTKIYRSTSCYLIAKRLSARLLILQCVFSVGGVWCHALGMQFVTLRNAICHPSGMQFVTLQECNLSLRNAICHPSGMQFVMLRNAICHAQECNLSRSGIQLKVWLMHKTSIPSRNAIKSCVQKFVRVYR